MVLADKIKTGLDEMRMLVLGCQVLIGFQFQAVFQDGFEDLPAAARLCNGLAMLLMTGALALLLVPGMQHNLIDRHHATRRIADVITYQGGLALLPFALALGIDLAIASRAAFGADAAIVLGVSGTAAALWFWYGLEHRRRERGRRERAMADERQDEHTDVAKRIDYMLTEARTVLPGVQALLGFQLVVALTHGFAALPTSSRVVHGLGLVAVALAVVLLMTPAAYHRLVYAGEASHQFLLTGSRFVAFATAPLALGLCADAYVVMAKITQSTAVGIAIGSAMGLVLASLWHVYPLLRRYQRGVAETDGRMASRRT
jgi:hypothetical protein